MNRQLFRSLVRSLGYDGMAVIYAALGLRSEMMASLRQSLEERAGLLAFIMSSPSWFALRGDPDFEAFVGEIHQVTARSQ